MIEALKKPNKIVMYPLIGVAVTFSILKDMIAMAGAAAYSSGLSYSTTLTVVSVIAVVVFSFFAKFLVYISFRINGAIFTRKSGMLYPFPIGYREFESTVLAFSLPCFLLAGAVVVPTLFYPTLSRVLGAVRSLVIWGSLAATVAYFVKKDAHDYDKKSLAISLSMIPLIFLGISLFLNLVEVIR